eukprot:16137129-Heterocapsa_arctica.AAC.1
MDSPLLDDESYAWAHRSRHRSAAPSQEDRRHVDCRRQPAPRDHHQHQRPPPRPRATPPQHA